MDTAEFARARDALDLANVELRLAFAAVKLNYNGNREAFDAAAARVIAAQDAFDVAYATLMALITTAE